MRGKGGGCVRIFGCGWVFLRMGFGVLAVLYDPGRGPRWESWGGGGSCAPLDGSVLHSC